MQLRERYWAPKRQKHGGSYLVALYNLHLLQGPLSLADKQRLSYVVYLFAEFPQTSLNEPPPLNNNRPSGFICDDGFTVRSNMMGYHIPDEKGIYRPEWWNSDDFKAFQCNYLHLCGCIASCIEGENHWNFRLADLEWLDEKAKSIHYTVCVEMKNPIPLVVDNKSGNVRPVEPTSQVPGHLIVGYAYGKASPEHKKSQIRSPLISIILFQEQQYRESNLLERVSPVITPTFEHPLPPSDRILHQAYQELIELINNHRTFRRCKAKATPRRPACQNIFLVKKRRGPKQCWCSNTCRRRIYEAKRAGNL